MERQTTISKEVEYSGTGLHTGNKSTITFKPAKENTGYIFVRTDVENTVEIPALTENVTDLSRGTTLGIGDVKVHTVEHVLAALAGLQIDNCRIELDNNEPPAVDGSAMPYVEALLEAGIEELDAEREYFIPDETIEYKNSERQTDIVCLPNQEFRATVMVDYFNPALGSQHTGLFDLKKEFVKEFAPARTFCFLTEVEKLYEANLIKGGSLDSAVVIIDREMAEEGEPEKIKDMFGLDKLPEIGKYGDILDNSDLRYPNEPARHKLLDMIGDMALIGVPIKAQILAARPGHASNFEFSSIIRKKYLEYKKKEKYMPKKDGFLYDIQDIMKKLPHRYPFLLVDRVMSIDPEKRTIRCLKNVSVNEPFFQGHFPGKPVMPGVLQLEGMAQSGGLLLFNVLPPEKVENKLALFMSIDKVKFRQPVLPGDAIIYEVTLTKEKFNINYFDCKAYVNGKLVSQCSLSAALTEKDYEVE
jgi:UDP-3-O-[3-hydroxymyristoyl] N-acetylglucosamine deacetylase/3-hydroxyacyl-[acyl-carrier-protein] dehydratase